MKTAIVFIALGLLAILIGIYYYSFPEKGDSEKAGEVVEFAEEMLEAGCLGLIVVGVVLLIGGMKKARPS